MTRRFIPLLLLLLLPAAVACTDRPDSTVVGPDARTGRQAASRVSVGLPDRAGPGALSVLTWNVYYGTDLTLALGGEAGLTQLIGLLQATDMPARAAGIAEQIESARPHLVGLQEVAHWTYDDGDTAFDLDFLSMLLAELDGYEVARETVTFDPPPLGPLGFTESVVVLAREDLATANPMGGVFAVGLPIEDLGLTLTKGWASVDAIRKGRTYRFVTTHLEPTDFTADVQRAQAAELVATLDALDDGDLPTLLTGDLNSEPDATLPDPYAQMTAAGFVDTWLVGRERGPGYTAGWPADLRMVEDGPGLERRIDHVLYRDAVTADGGPFRGSVHAERVGEALDDRVETAVSGVTELIWPSDHAGVLVTLRTAQKPQETPGTR